MILWRQGRAESSQAPSDRRRRVVLLGEPFENSGSPVFEAYGLRGFPFPTPNLDETLCKAQIDEHKRYCQTVTWITYNWDNTDNTKETCSDVHPCERLKELRGERTHDRFRAGVYHWYVYSCAYLCIWSSFGSSAVIGILLNGKVVTKALEETHGR